jgi:hypothetical protein
VRRFFNPPNHRVARDPKGALQTAQAAPLLISPQDFLATIFRVGMWSRMLAALSLARTTAIDLFPVRRMPIADHLVAPTVATADGDSDDHASALLAFSLQFTRSFSYDPLPEKRCHAFWNPEEREGEPMQRIGSCIARQSLLP